MHTKEKLIQWVRTNEFILKRLTLVEKIMLAHTAQFEAEHIIEVFAHLESVFTGVSVERRAELDTQWTIQGLHSHLQKPKLPDQWIAIYEKLFNGKDFDDQWEDAA